MGLKGAKIQENGPGKLKILEQTLLPVFSKGQWTPMSSLKHLFYFSEKKIAVCCSWTSQVPSGRPSARDHCPPLHTPLCPLSSFCVYGTFSCASVSCCAFPRLLKVDPELFDCSFWLAFISSPATARLAAVHAGFSPWTDCSLTQNFLLSPY